MTSESPQWFTPSFSENGGQCVEVATNLHTTTGTVPVRDSKNSTGPVLTVPAAAFSGFVNGLTSGAFDS
ncbi:DUF397 domain-containing protein [Streptomyces bohaiensis]|uniref:DUF397 domain-containing protein n=1 Tax=Streptomyces bohaiensis TaxID=1431344 RepID=A0ABX1C896_9ACTN|nr:DUF397 domain-containing protein [Streptomyces bohaiensis]NJQ15376.1 DUF397 domain-containing protein [Streptomyces bohaiensis]